MASRCVTGRGFENARRGFVLRGYWLAFSCLESGGRSGFSARSRHRCGDRRGSGPTAWPARPARSRPSRKLWSSRPASVTTATRGALVCETAISSLLPARLQPPPLWCQRYKPRSVLVLLRDGCSGARHDLTGWDPRPAATAAPETGFITREQPPLSLERAV